MKIGVVCSGGGSVIISAHEIMKDCGFNFSFSIVTDRECGVELAAKKAGLDCRRIVDADRDSFSSRVAEWLYDEQNVQLMCLFFSRLVGEAIYNRGLCINFHPSLLPAFPGFGALKAALQAKAKFFGATAHLVDHTIDSGQIIAQTIASLPPDATLQQMERVSFAQKVYLMLSISEALLDGSFQSLLLNSNAHLNNRWCFSCSPPIKSQRLEEGFRRFTVTEGIPWNGGFNNFI